MGRGGPLQQGRRDQCLPGRRHRTTELERERDQRCGGLSIRAHRQAIQRTERSGVPRAAVTCCQEPAVPRQRTGASGRAALRAASDGPGGPEVIRSHIMNDNAKIPHIKSVETRHLEERETLFRGLHNLDRRSFLKVSTGAAAAAVAAGVSNHFHSFLPVNVAYDTERGGSPGFTLSYISAS